MIGLSTWVFALIQLAYQLLVPYVQGDDADHFNPDRFIGEDGQLSPALADTRSGECPPIPKPLFALTRACFSFIEGDVVPYCSSFGAQL